MEPPKPQTSIGGVCDWCRELVDTVKFCASCRVARYCSTECQNKHWSKYHHKVCKNLHLLPQAPVVDLKDICLAIAAALSLIDKGQFIPQKLFCPIIRKQKQSDLDTHIILGDEMEQFIEPKYYDLTADSQENSCLSWMRVYGLQMGSILNRAACLALNTALLSGRFKLSLEGRAVASIGLYVADNKCPKWTLVSMPENGDSEDPAECTTEQQDPSHMFIGFRVPSNNADDPTDSTYFVDFNAYSAGIFAVDTFCGSPLFLLHGWASKIRLEHPLLYRNGKLFRDQTWINQWTQIWPEIVASQLPRQMNSELQHQILLSKVTSVETALASYLATDK